MQGAALGADGALYVTLLPDPDQAARTGGLYKYHSGQWSDITPRAGWDYNALAVDPHNPQHLIVVHQAHGFQNEFFISEDGGATWRTMQYTAHWNVPWYLREMWASSVSSVAFDPHHPNRVWYTDWYNIWRTEDISQPISAWQNLPTGHEETVTMGLLCPPSGPPLFSMVADVSGFRHDVLDAYPPNILANLLVQDITGLAHAETDPQFMALTGARRWEDKGDGAFSTDGGLTWTKFPTLPPGAQHGRAAVSADGTSIVWIPTDQVPYYTMDRGQTWRASQGVPPNTVGVLWNTDMPLASDKRTPGRFYLLRGKPLNRSDDGGATWRTVSQIDAEFAGAYRALHTATNGDIWAQLDTGLFVSRDSGETFTQVSVSMPAHLFALGASRSEYPYTVYVLSKIGDFTMGLSVSEDGGRTFSPFLSFAPEEVPLFNAQYLCADRQVFGRVFVGMNGRGVWMGEYVP
jgi:hypothetical protein